MSDETLKPCPFCGSSDSLHADSSGAYVACAGCGATGPDFCLSPPQAAAEWNRRLESTQLQECAAIAYGLLWHITSADDTLNAARQLLRDTLTRTQQGEGIERARVAMQARAAIRAYERAHGPMVDKCADGGRY